jgi:hypothetical protein
LRGTTLVGGRRSSVAVVGHFRAAVEIPHFLRLDRWRWGSGWRARASTLAASPAPAAGGERMDVVAESYGR